MSTQYNTIQGPYDLVRKKSIAIIEWENVHSTIAPYIRDANVLELACGSGFYTYSFLEWGARHVLAVDISPVMIEEAKRRRPASLPAVNAGSNEEKPAVDFLLADCSKPTAYPGGPFDVVFGAWLLNYAPDRAGLIEMFQNIAVNLKPGGHFVAVTVPPTNDPRANVEAECNARPLPDASGGLFYSVHHDVPDGIYFHVHGHTELGDVAFDCYHLTEDLHKEAAREAGLKGEWQWGVTSVPERYLRGEGPGGASFEELKTYVTVPNYGLLVIGK